MTAFRAVTALDKQAIRQLIPHAFGMCLLDRVVRWDARTIDCLSDSHNDPDNPLRGAAGLHALHAFEYAAQAAAVHGALLAGGAAGRGAAAGEPAFLAAVRDARLAVARLDGLAGALAAHAELVLSTDAGTVYAFVVGVGGESVASGRLTVMPRRPA